MLRESILFTILLFQLSFISLDKEHLLIWFPFICKSQHKFSFYNSLVSLKSQVLPQCLVPTSNFLVVQWFILSIVNSLAISNPFTFCGLSFPFRLQPSTRFLVPFLSFCVPRSFETTSLMKFQASCRHHSLFYNRGDSLGNLQVINCFLRAKSK